MELGKHYKQSKWEKGNETTTLAVTSVGWTGPWVKHVFVFLMEYESQESQAQRLLNPEP